MKTIITVVIKLFTTARRMGSGIGGGGWSTSIIMVIITFGSDREATHRMGTGLAVRTRWIWATAFELFHLDTGTKGGQSEAVTIIPGIILIPFGCALVLIITRAACRAKRCFSINWPTIASTVSAVYACVDKRTKGWLILLVIYLPPNKDQPLPVPHPISTYRDLDVVRGIGFIFTENCIRWWLEEKLEKCTIILLNDCGGGGPNPININSYLLTHWF